MITELTEEQKKMIPVYVEKWAKIGLSCEPVKDYEETINLFYEKVLNKKRPAKIILASSPLQAWEQLCEQVEKQGRKQVSKQVWHWIEQQVLEQVELQVWEQIRQRQQIMQVWELSWQLLGRQEVGWEVVLKYILQQIGNQVSQQVGCYFFPYSYRGLQRGLGPLYFALYDYFNEALDIQYPETWFIYKKMRELLIYPLDDICIVCDRPKEIIIQNSILHNPHGMAIKYKDDWDVYTLNSVRVTKELFETPPDKLDPEIILKERNAEVRREIVRKIGIERLEKKLKPRVLDRWGDYELHDYSHLFPNMRCKPVYLKMKNPSIGVWHYEGVNINEMESPTCQAALKWRLKGKDFKPIRIT